MLRVVTQIIVLDRPQPLTITQGEDRKFRLVFLDPATADDAHPDGKPVNLVAGGTFTQSLRDPDGGLIASILGALTTDGTDGSVDFTWGSADTIDEVPQVDYWDCKWKDPSGSITELAVSAPFEVLPAQWRSTDTHNPAPIVVPGDFTQPFSGTSSALITVPILAVPSHTAVEFEVRVVAQRLADDAVFGMKINATVANRGSSSSANLAFIYDQSGSLPPYDVVGPRHSYNAAAWDCELALDDSTGQVLMTLQIDFGSVTGAVTATVTATP